MPTFVVTLLRTSGNALRGRVKDVASGEVRTFRAVTELLSFFAEFSALDEVCAGERWGGRRGLEDSERAG